MNIIETPIPGLLILEPRVFADDRGYFFESFSETKFLQKGLNYKFVQDNESKSSFGVIRGLHYQLAPYAQTKLIRVVEGVVFDVAVDLREGSPTFGQWFGLEVSAEKKNQLLIPKGFAHGFSVLSEYAIFSYKCDEFYNPAADRGIRLNDPTLNIDWKVPFNEGLISGKDLKSPTFKEAEMNFKYNPND